MKNNHKMPENIFVVENADEFTLLKEINYKGVGKCDWNILHKKDSGTNAKFTAEEVCKRYNAHEELVKCLQAFVYQIETYNLKHEFPGAYMDAKNALQKLKDTPVNQ